MTGPVSARYGELVETGELEHHDDQIKLAADFDALFERLKAHKPQKPSKGLLASLFSNSEKSSTPKGLYIWGEVGRGKTMMMDLFYDLVPIKAKRRDHFVSFMQSVHAAVFDIRQKQKNGEIWDDTDPVQLAARKIADETTLLCFDEFQVTDIADAMMLGRLFDALHEAGVVVVATSNRPPDLLYKDGLNRTSFLPFIEKFKQQMVIVALDHDQDYRIGQLVGEKVYFSPLNAEAVQAIERLWHLLTETDAGGPEVLIVQGRELAVPQVARGVAKFTFDKLCREPLAGADYIALASNYKTIFITGIPVLQPADRNPAKRLINAVDVFYDRGIHLVISAAAEPDELCTEGPHAFEFARTASRLTEMRSASYWENRT